MRVLLPVLVNMGIGGRSDVTLIYAQTKSLVDYLSLLALLVYWLLFAPTTKAPARPKII